MARRAFLRRACALALPVLVLPAMGKAALAVAPGPRKPVNVREHGAVGDGVHDDTAAFQAAIDSLLLVGGTVSVPAGRYLIDAARSVRLRSHTRLVMDRDAVLLAKPNALERYAVVLIRGVIDAGVSGGRIVGERSEHTGSKGEWGHGISVLGARHVSIRDVDISACWGDGIWVGTIFGRGGAMKVASDVTIERVTCRGNRRQGLSITASRRVTVRDSHFRDTGGTAPGCGIDVEPDTMKMGAEDVLISGCSMSGNHGSGLSVAGENVLRLRLERCDIRSNRGYGVLVTGAGRVVLADNTIADNGLSGTYLRRGVRSCVLAGNTFSRNGTRYMHEAIKQAMQAFAAEPASRSKRDLKVDDGVQATVMESNRYLR
ncbi:right-handed parallel beta-helix repeat-containing protein [Dyella sp.]|jgi:parallel beta-helix repeat protein|uniref:right-handed parallel beta-helix repeat-containing protein n=1 Tax=Dyella sp. TaxID=1869338 RepID=UPI002D76E032|nr:right-handed parallel beta-helix repeat-containing protein [Dyella sp.]HET6431611.1 right-handed parallel beta-helix repeat-containing protein [Dyella sp.]